MNWAGDPLSSSYDPAQTGGRQGPQGVPIGGEQPSPFDLLVGIPVGSRVLLTLPAQTGTDAAKESVAVVIDVLGVQTAPRRRSTPVSEKPEIDFPEGPPPSELEIIDLTEGDGPEAHPGATAVVHYVGVAYSTGEEFDASWNRGQSLRVPARRRQRHRRLGPRGRRA